MYRVFDLTQEAAWNKYFKKLPVDQQDIYYTPEYYSLYENYGDGKAQCFVFEHDGEIALYPFLINSVNKLGYDLDDEYFDIQGAYGYNGVVSSSYNKGFIDSFYLAFAEWCNNNNIVAEFTRFHPILQNHLFSQAYFNVIFDRPIVYIDVNKSYEELWGNLQRTTRKQINRCYKRYNFQIEMLENEQYDLNVFEEIYKESMVRVNSSKYLYFNHQYFEQLLKLPITIQYIVKDHKQPISTIIAIKGSKILHGHLGGTTTEYTTYSPFSMLYWEMIKTAKKDDFDYVHVGGGNTTDKDDKLLAFKKHFSSTVNKFYIGKKIHKQKIYDQILNQWQSKYLDLYKKNSIKLLGYRDI